MSGAVTLFSDRLSEFDDFQFQIRGIGLDIVPLRSAPFWCQTDALIGSDFSFTAGSFQSHHRYRGVSHATHVLLGIHYGPQGMAHFGSNHALPGDLSVLQPGQEHFGSAGAPLGTPYQYVALSMDRALLERSGAADRLLRSNALLTQNLHLRADVTVATAVRDGIAQMAKVAFRPEASSTAARMRLLKRSLAYPFLLVAANSQSEADCQVLEPKAAIVRRAEHWLDSEPPEKLHTIDLCLALGLPLRTVQRAFQETVGMGPVRYLMYYRLHKVRQILRSCDPTATRVTDVALDHGFWELGRFSGLYSRTYGERPSETLRRRAQAG